MTFWTAILIFLGVAFAISAGIFVLAARIVMGDWPSPARGIGAFLACFILSGALHLGGAWVGAQLGAEWPEYLAALASLVLVLGTVATILPATTYQAFAILLLQAIVGVALLLPAAWLFKQNVFDAYHLPYGSMMPSMRGMHQMHRCENCGLTFPVSDSLRGGTPDEADVAVCTNCGAEEPIASTSPLLGGDRFAVDRSGNPERWTVMALESPQEPGMNFVARVVCFPAEHIDIFEGDVFINGRRWPRMAHEFLEMWIPVADSDFTATNTLPAGHGWSAGEGSTWKQADQIWNCEAKGEAAEELRMAGVIDDSYSYNASDARQAKEPYVPVADLRLDCEVASLTGDGHLALRWKARGKTITVEFTTGKAGPREQSPNEQTVRFGDIILAPEGETLSLAIRDGRYAVLRNGTSLWNAEFLPANFGEAKQVVSAREAPPQLSILAKDCAVSVRRIRVARDVYYLAKEETIGGDDPDFHSSMSMGQTDYFVVGDNSRISRDSRFIGPVPRANFRGRVRTTYWPLERAREWE